MRKTILLVDDSATARMKSRSVFGDDDYKVISACDGKEGIELAVAERPDLILMDVEMPRMNGFEACRALKQHDVTKDIPVVLLTMRSEAEMKRAGADSGCSEYMLKTALEDKLRSVVKKYLQ